MKRDDMNWMYAYSGKQWFFRAPSYQDVDITDIALALSNMCRYAGHVRPFYSVAEHSCHVSDMVAPEHRLWGLLHDASEAYMNDLQKPLKEELSEYKHMEGLAKNAIMGYFDLPEDEPPEVKRADNTILFVEKAQLQPRRRNAKLEAQWGMGAQFDYDKEYKLVLPCWQPAEAEKQFLKRYEELKKK